MSKLVLIVDDDEANIRLASSLLCHRFKLGKDNILTAKNGEEGLDLFRRHPNLDLILTDYKLPEMTGIEMAERIRESSDVPIVILTSSDLKELSKKALGIGINNMLSKPYKIDAFYNVCKQYI